MKKILIVILMIFSFISLVGCKEPYNPDEIVAIQIDPSTLPEKINKSEAISFTKKLALIITYADGTKDYIAFDKSMISEEDYINLFSPGVYTIKVNYLNLQTEFNIEVYEKITTYYKLTVVYPDNTKVTDKLNIKWCYNSDFQKNTVLVDGESEIVNDNKEYFVYIYNIPKGYTYNPNIHYVNSENTELVIKLIPLIEFVEGDGSKWNPYTITEGTYKLSFDLLSLQGAKYYAFTPAVSGKYTFESYADEKNFNHSICDPHMGYIGETMDLGNIDFSANDENYRTINFKYSFDAEVGKTYYFIIFLSQSTDLPAAFNVSIYK